MIHFRTWTSGRRGRPGSRQKRGQGWLQVFGRIAPGAAFEHATAELRALSEEPARQHPVSNADRIFAVASLQDRQVEPIRPALLVLVGAVGLVLLITCANVANLILVRSAGRTRELAVRMSLGACRGRLAGQLLVEGLVLVALGAAVGLTLALGATRGLVALGAPGVPRLAELQVDATVLFFTMLVSGLTSVVFGLVPLLRLSGADTSHGLREGGRSGEGHGAPWRRVDLSRPRKTSLLRRSRARVTCEPHPKRAGAHPHSAVAPSAERFECQMPVMSPSF